jgi:hypothetical protein
VSPRRLLLLLLPRLGLLVSVLHRGAGWGCWLHSWTGAERSTRRCTARIRASSSTS